MFQKSVTAVRWLLGIQYLMSGINWWYKILPFPSMHDPLVWPGKHQVVTAMIASGWMFGMSKSLEVVTGLALVFNRFVPLMLVASMSIAVVTYLLDAFIGDAITGWITGVVPTGIFLGYVLDLVYWGGAVLAMQLYLVFAYFDVYRPMLVSRALPRMP